MKRKIVSMLLTTTMIFTLFGCGEEDVVETESSVSPTTVVESTEEVESTVVESETKESEPVAEIVPQVVEGEDSLCYDDTLYLLDGNGYIYDTVTKEELANYSFLTDDEKKLVENSSLKGVCQNLILCWCPKYNSDDGKEKFFAIDCENEQILMIFDTEDYSVSDYVFYDNKLFLLCSADDNYTHKYEICYIKTENGFEMVENKVQSLLDTYQEDGMGNLVNGQCYSSNLEQFGFVVAKNGNSFVLVDANGNETATDIPTDDSYVSGYTQNYILYSMQNPDSLSYEYIDCFYNINTKTSIQAQDKGDFFVSGNKLYLVCDESLEYGISEYHMYEYSPEAGKLEEVYSTKDVPGMGSTLSGYSGLTFKEDAIYYLQEEEGKVVWYLSKYTDAGYSPECIDVVVSENHTYDLGSISFRSHQDVCEQCGFVYGRIYTEGFLCNLDFPGVTKINQTLCSIEDTAFQGSCLTVFDYGMDDDSLHDLSYNYYSSDFTVDDASVLGSHYLQVTFGGYDYSGGAHGYPILGQHVFDLNTGDEVGINDLYKGTSEEFSILVAENTRDHFNSCNGDSEGYTPYFAESADEVYEQALETDLSSVLMIFEEEEAYVVYTPYEMGPFSSGYIYVPVSYEKLGFSFD